MFLTRQNPISHVKETLILPLFVPPMQVSVKEQIAQMLRQHHGLYFHHHYGALALPMIVVY